MSGPAVPVDVVRVRRGRDPLPLPRYMTAGAAGMDLLADVDADVVLGAGERRLVPTGLTIAIPAGFEGQVRPRSGLAARDGVTVLNGPGTIDSDYRGEVQVLLVNLGADSVRIRRGDRIAQLVVAPVTTVILREVDALPASERGAGGFGSTDARGARREATTGAQRAPEEETTGAQRAPEEETTGAQRAPEE